MNGMNIGKFVHALLYISKFYGERALRTSCILVSAYKSNICLREIMRKNIKNITKV